MASQAIGEMTGQLVDRVRSVEVESVPDEAFDVMTHVLVDGIGVMLAGSSEPLGVGRVVSQWVKELGGAGEASLVAGGVKVPTTSAAFANGTMAHALDFDNFWHPRNHPFSPTVPALLALGEKYDFPPVKVLTAALVAFEVQVRLRMASIGLDTGAGFHKPGMTGTMGSAAACSWLLDLDREQMAMALGIAGSRAGSLAINSGTMTKSSHSGHAARMGLECAELAKRGWTASTGVFDEGGYFDTFLGDRYDASLLIDGFADPFYVVDPGIGFKKYPSNGFTQRPIDAVFQLQRDHDFEVDDIESIEVDVPPFDYVNRPAPKDGLDAKFSVQYTVSVALLDKSITVDSFSDERRFSPDVEALLEKISLNYDDAISISSVETLVRLRLRMKDGRVLECTKQDISGLVGIPLSRDERLTKFFGCTDRLMERSRAERLLSLIEDFENLESLEPLMHLVCNVTD